MWRQVFDLSGIFFKEVSWSEQEEVNNWITRTKGYEPLVMDADDLQQNPGEKLSFFLVISLCANVVRRNLML